MVTSKRFLHSICAAEQAVAADSVLQVDLTVNPLSVVLLRVNCLNDNSGTVVNGLAKYLDLAAAFNRISILHRGQSVISGRGEDLAALNYFRRGCLPMEANGLDTDNDKRSCVIPLFLGRFPYDDSSCFPATKRGELVLELDIDVADTGYDTFRVQVETIELLDASPKEYERQTSINRTFAATGLQDFILPNGNTLRGLLAWGTTAYSGGSPAATWGTRMEFRKDNEQYGYSATDFDTAHMLGALMGRQPPVVDNHTHRVDATASSTIAQTGRPITVSKGGWENYAWLDFDPTRDDQFSVDTSKSSYLAIRANVGAADAARVMMVERIAV